MPYLLRNKSLVLCSILVFVLGVFSFKGAAEAITAMRSLSSDQNSLQEYAVFGEGWYPLEGGGIRWTAPRAVVEIFDQGEDSVHLQFYVPDAQIQQLSVVQIEVSVNRKLVDVIEFATPGYYYYHCPVTLLDSTSRNALVQLRALKTFHPAHDARELGVAVIAASAK